MKKLSQNPEAIIVNTKEKTSKNKFIGLLASIGTISALSIAPASFAANSSNFTKVQNPKITQPLTRPELKTPVPSTSIANYRNNRGDRRVFDQRILKYYENDDLEYNRAVNDLDDAVSKCYRLSNSNPRLNCNAISSRVESMKAFARLARLEPSPRNLISLVDEFMNLLSTNTDTLIGFMNTKLNNEIEYRQNLKFNNVRNVLINGDNLGFLGVVGIYDTVNRRSAQNYAVTFGKGLMILAKKDIDSILNFL